MRTALKPAARPRQAMGTHAGRASGDRRMWVQPGAYGDAVAPVVMSVHHTQNLDSRPSTQPSRCCDCGKRCNNGTGSTSRATPRWAAIESTSVDWSFDANKWSWYRFLTPYPQYTSSAHEFCQNSCDCSQNNPPASYIVTCLVPRSSSQHGCACATGRYACRQ